jgi:hypothetical protein
MAALSPIAMWTVPAAFSLSGTEPSPDDPVTSSTGG